MVSSAIVYTRVAGGSEAGLALGKQIAGAFDGAPPAAVLVFASAAYDARALLAALHEACKPELVVGGTMVGGFTSRKYLDGAACAVAFRSGEIHFSASLGRGLSASRSTAAEELVSGFEGVKTQADIYRSAIVLTDARARQADDFVQDLTLRTKGRYQILGGGAADDPLLVGSHVFFGTEVYTDAAVALEVLSKAPLGVGVCRSWEAYSAPMRVTETEGKRLISLNAVPAADMMEEHARATHQVFDSKQPSSFFLRNLIGIDLGNGYKMRTPLAVQEDGSVVCAAEVPEGATVRMMRTSAELARESALEAVRNARTQIADRRPSLGIFFDCAMSRQRRELGHGIDLRTVEDAVGTMHYVGFGLAGQIVRAEGEFAGFYNSTCVLLLFPE